MLSILKTKPQSTFKMALDITYDDILHAVATKNTNRFLQGIISTCKAYPDTVVFVIYKYGENSVVMVYGEEPTAMIMDGHRLTDKLPAEEGCLYVWCHKLES